jgi:oleandomycin transport system ATP-binding protein
VNVIEATGLTKRFGTTQALAGADLAAREGTVLGSSRSAVASSTPISSLARRSRWPNATASRSSGVISSR